MSANDQGFDLNKMIKRAVKKDEICELVDITFSHRSLD